MGSVQATWIRCSDGRKVRARLPTSRASWAHATSPCRVMDVSAAAEWSNVFADNDWGSSDAPSGPGSQSSDLFGEELDDHPHMADFRPLPRPGALHIEQDNSTAGLKPAPIAFSPDVPQKQPLSEVADAPGQ